jgi:transcriptional regulator with XRE-family HTH domain
MYASLINVKISAAGIRRWLRILELRAEGHSQDEVAQRVRCHPSTVARVERGLRRGNLRVPAGTISPVLLEEYRQARAKAIRVRLLSSIAALAIEQSRRLTEELQLDELRSVGAFKGYADLAEGDGARTVGVDRFRRTPTSAPRSTSSRLDGDPRLAAAVAEILRQTDESSKPSETSHPAE